MQSQGPSQFPSRLPPHLVTSSPRWETRPLSGWCLWGLWPARGGIWPHRSAFCRAPLNLVCGFGGQAGRSWPVAAGGPYRGRSVLLCRVFRAVPSSRGRALCRLDMATVFLRSITA